MPWPCNETKYISHFPETREIWSYGSGYGGNALLGKKCYALRIASVMARDQGWLAEHMLILKITPPSGEARYVAAAFPSACGKTNLAMMAPAIPGWKVETIGDDIAWMRFGAGRPAVRDQPRGGVLRRRAGHRGHDQRQRGRDLHGQQHLHQRGADRRRGRVVGGPDRRAAGAPDRLEGPGLDARSRRSPRRTRIPGSPPRRASARSSRAEWDDPAGVPISAILFGGRRASAVPLVTESFGWDHGVFLGANIASEKTAAAEGTVGELRHDPFAMLPFCGYNMGDYFGYWLKIGQIAPDPGKLPKLFYVNWFRKDAAGRFVWPGFGENIRVLKWIVQRLDGQAEAVETPIGLLPAPGSLDLDGLEISQADLDLLLTVDRQAWKLEADQIPEFFRGFGDHLPARLRELQQDLIDRLG